MSEANATSAPISLVPSRTDADKADGYRKELGPMLEDLCGLLNRARQDGLVVNIALPLDSFGRYVPQVNVVKPL